ncbi:phage tail protein [Escherichia coli]|nr:phage tail protein [Escherichia coli]
MLFTSFSGSLVSRIPGAVQMQVASEHIAPLQDAADLEIATEEETSLLEAWKKYRVLLNRVDTSTAPDIEWPTNPVRE